MAGRHNQHFLQMFYRMSSQKDFLGYVARTNANVRRNPATGLTFDGLSGAIGQIRIPNQTCVARDAYNAVLTDICGAHVHWKSLLRIGHLPVNLFVLRLFDMHYEFNWMWHVHIKMNT